ncbi:MAG TPA: sugar ABC transporter ATP-binding protein [Burkholderiales bacterium]|nr:sugar ABC transporter ATP-binding protein [Burkholderiales bacterium]
MSSELPLLEATGVGKTYAIPVLSDVHLTLYRGEVLALTGENGAGKSTLSKIISGVTPASTGRMTLDGQTYSPSSRLAAEHQGVRMVMQELNLIPTLSIAENLFLGQLPTRFGFIDRTALHEAARQLMAKVGLEKVDPGAAVGTLGIGHQQMIEIARSLIGECKLLILDEPTAMLTDHEVDLLFAQIARLKAAGVSIIYISHRLDEIKQISDRIAVLRDGKLVSSDKTSELHVDDIVRLMVGRDLGDQIDLGERKIGAPALRVRNLSRSASVRDVSFDLRSGEILGFAGLIGSGRTELLRLIFGADRKDAGDIYLADNPEPARITSPLQAVANGIAMITEDRKGQGLLTSQSISINTTLASLPSVSRKGWIRFAMERGVAQRYVKSLGMKCNSVQQSVAELSGGTQQKVVVGRWLHRDCPVMLFDEPTRGIDIGAKFDIYNVLGNLSRQGKGLVVVSSDLRELMLICDRIAVMSAGKLVKIFERGAWTQNAILEEAFSGYVENTKQRTSATA